MLDSIITAATEQGPEATDAPVDLQAAKKALFSAKLPFMNNKKKKEEK